MAEVTIGIDIGTTSVKAVAADADGHVVARARVPHRLEIPAPDCMEHDATAAWRRGPRRALAALGPVGARSLAVAAMVPSLTAVDRRGIPRTPGLLYGDARGRPGAIANPAGGGEVLEFLRWTVRQYPDAHGYWSAPAVANYALCGEGALDFGTAFSTTPLFGGGTGGIWDEDVLAACGAGVTQMPRVAMMGAPVGKVGDAVLGAGGVDAMCEQLVAGADDDGDVLVICGTTLIVWVVLDRTLNVPGLWTIPHTTPGRFIVGGASNAGGLFLDWVRRLFPARLSHRAAGSPAASAASAALDPHRIPVWEPYIRGERTPWHDPDRRAVLHDLDLTHGPDALLRAAYEASAFVLRHHLDLVATSPRRLVVSGGGTRVAAWVQALADATGLPADVVAVPEGAALGAAWLARMAAGLETSTSDAARWARTSHRVEPDPAWVGPVAERYARFRVLADGVGSAGS